MSFIVCRLISCYDFKSICELLTQCLLIGELLLIKGSHFYVILVIFLILHTLEILEP